MFTSIVVGVDCREGGRDALALATLLHAAGGGKLVALHACASAPLIHEDVLILVEDELARAGATGRAIVVTDRSPAHALRTIAEREGAELIVVGSSRRGGVDRVLAGDDAAATLHCAPCAVAVAPRGFASAPGTLRRIGVGFDDSRESRLRAGARPPSRPSARGRRPARHHGGDADRCRSGRRSPGTPRGPARTPRPCSRTTGCSPPSPRSSATTSRPRRWSAPRGRSWPRAARTWTCSSSAHVPTGRCVGWCSAAHRRSSRAAPRVRCSWPRAALTARPW